MRSWVALPLALMLALSACTDSRTVDPPTTSTAQTTSTATVATTTTTRPESTTSSSTSTVPEPEYDIVIEGTAPDITVTGPDRFAVTPGEMFEITIFSSISEELHVHGYDLFYDLEAGTETLVTFHADIPGIFEAELEGLGRPLFELEVAP